MLKDNMGSTVLIDPKDIVIITCPNPLSMDREAKPTAIVNAQGGHIIVNLNMDTYRKLIKYLGYDALEVSGLVES